METIIYNIDSRNRNKQYYPNSSQYRYLFPNDIKNIVEINFSSCEFPNTNYTINSKKDNNIFKITIIDNSNLPTFTINIDDGNYNAIEIADIINNIYFKSICHAIDNLELSLTLNINSGKYKILCNKQFTLDFTNYSDYPSLGSHLGFKNKIYTQDDLQIDNTLNKSFIIAENIPNFIGENYAFVKINNFGHILNNNIKYLSKIVISADKYEMNFDSRNKFVTKKFNFTQPETLKHLDIKIDDYNSNLLDFNGVDFSFTLEFKIIKNTLLKKYHELTFYSGDLFELILHDKMLEFYNNANKIETNKVFLNNNIANTYLQELNKQNSPNKQNIVNTQIDAIDNSIINKNYNEIKKKRYYK